MKRWISFLLAVVFVSSCANFSLAADRLAVTVDVPSSAKPGEIINLTVLLPKESNAKYGSMNLSYDYTMLEIVSCTTGVLLNDCNAMANPAYTLSSVRLSFESETPLAQGGIALNVAFRVLQTAGGTVKFCVEKCKLFDEDYRTIDIENSTEASTYIINEASTTITVDCDKNAVSGDSINATVLLNDPIRVYGGAFNLIYDAAALTLQSATVGAALSGTSKQLNKNYASNKVRLTWAGAAPLTTGGTLLSLSFTVNDGYAGSCPILLEAVGIADVDGKEMDCATANDAIDITCKHQCMKWIATTEATCLEPGEETYSCNCGYTDGVRAISANGHGELQWKTITEATCTSIGERALGCSNCSYVEKTETVPATGHQNMKWVTTVDETCENAGERAYSCADCGYVEKTEPVPAHGHQYTDSIVPPTRTKGGYTEHVCMDCGYSYRDSDTEPLGYTITFDAAGGTDAPTVQHKIAGKNVVLPNTVPKKVGFTFLGWTPVIGAEEAEYFSGGLYCSDEDITLYAVWMPNSHRITYKVDGEIYCVRGYAYGSLVDAEPEPAKEGYTFCGWEDLPVTMPDADVEINGRFSINSYTVSFAAQGAENQLPDMTAEYGSQITLPTAKKTNSVFVGWGKSSTAINASYLAGDSITVKGDLTLYAIWTEIWTGTVSASLSGTGTRLDPYCITSAADLAFVQKKINGGDKGYASANYILLYDIVLNDVSNCKNWATKAPKNAWSPIGTGNNPFSGVFDGNGHSIWGLYIRNSWSGNIGLFAYVTNGEIRSLACKDGYISGKTNVGALAAQLSGGKLVGCTNEITVAGSETVGGLIGLAKNSEIADCGNYGNVTGSGQYVGGICGTANNTKLFCCYNAGTVKTTGKDVGGIAGSISAASSMLQCWNEGEINGTTGVGGMVSVVKSSSLKDCLNSGNVSGSNIVGGICGGDGISTEPIERCIFYESISGSTNVDAIDGSGSATGIVDCYYYGYCGALNATAYPIFNYEPDNYSYYASQYTNSWKDGWEWDGSEFGRIVPKGTQHFKENSPKRLHLTYDLNGGKFEERMPFCVFDFYPEGYVSSTGQDAAVYVADRANVRWYLSELRSDDVMIVLNSRGIVTDLVTAGTDVQVIQDARAVVCNGLMKEWALSHVEIGDQLQMDCSHGSAVLCKSGDSSHILPTLYVLPVPKREGYFFEGWYDDNGEALMDGAMTGYVTAHAKWSKPIPVKTGTYQNRKYELYLVPTCLSAAEDYCRQLGGHIAIHDHSFLTTLCEEANIAQGGAYISQSDPYLYRDSNLSVGVEAMPDYGYPVCDGFICEYEDYSISGTVLHNGHEYYLCDEAATWEDAEAFCEKLGGHLATVSDVAENTAISNLIAEYGNGSVSKYWLGGTDKETEGIWTWVTGEPWDYTNWYADQPDDEDGVEHYLCNSGMWEDLPNKGGMVGFICELDTIRMPTITYADHEYIAFNQKMSWKEAKAVCEAMGGHLATVTSAEEDAAIQSLLKDQPQQMYWLGATDEGSEGTWNWITGEPWKNYTHWARSQPDNGNKNEHFLQVCGNPKGVSWAKTGEWNDSANENNQFTIGFICEMEPYKPVKELEYAGNRYSIFDVCMTWDDAKAYCEKLGGHLATVTSSGENSAISNACKSYGIRKQYWLGATDRSSQGTWNWITGEMWDYTNWRSSRPNGRTNEDYLQMYRSSTSGNWQWDDGYADNVDASSTSYGFGNVGFVCEFEALQPVATMIYGGHCYRAFNENFGWHEAEAYCEKLDGHLATITSEQENANITALIEGLDRPCYWLGATDEVKEKTWKWVTNEKFNYTNWDTSQPDNSNGIEDYLEIGTKRRSAESNGRWNDSETPNRTLCGFICENDYPYLYTEMTTVKPVDETIFNGRKYEIYDLLTDQQGAENFCWELGGHLATISSQEENQAISGMLNGRKWIAYWLAGHETDREGTWTWNTGERWDYTNWAENQPDNWKADGKNRGENALHIYSSANGDPALTGYWNDCYDDALYGFICEYENEVSGTYKNISWKFADGALTLSGTGAIAYSSEYPWDQFWKRIQTVSVKSGITDISCGFENVRGTVATLTIPTTLTAARYVLRNCFAESVVYEGTQTEWEQKNIEGTVHQFKKYLVTCDEQWERILSAGESVTLPTMSREGETFLGWSVKQNATAADYAPGERFTPTEDITLYGVWKSEESGVEVFTVTFDANGGSHAPDLHLCRSGRTLKISEAIPQKEGYTFLGWSEWQNAVVPEYAPGDEFCPVGNTVLFAVWQLVEPDSKTYAVSFDANGGENAPVPLTCEQGNSVTLPEQTPARAEYRFCGWSEDPAAVQGQYMPKDALTPTGNLTLYAVWKPVMQWKITEGVLSFPETETIPDCDMGGAPWYGRRNEILTVDLTGIASVGSYAMQYCTQLTSATVAPNVTYGTGVYANCAGLTAITVEDGVTALPEALFRNCGELAAANLPESLALVPASAFEGTALTAVTYGGTKTEFAALLETAKLQFGQVTCSDGNTYAYEEFFPTVVPVTGVSLDRKSAGLTVGETVQLTAAVYPENAENKAVSWTTDNEAVATVDHSGQVTATGVGVTEITVTTTDGDYSTFCTVYVSEVMDPNAPIIFGTQVESFSGETFMATIALQNNPGITSLRLRIDYDKNAMTLTQVEDLGKLGDANHADDLTADPYTLYWGNETLRENITENGDVVRLTFAIREDAAAGEYPIAILYDYNDADALNCELLPVYFDVVDGSVIVESILYGDVNGDGRVNPKDSMELGRYIARWKNVYVDTRAADVNRDGRVNPKDSLILKRYVSHWSDYTELPYSEEG